MHARPWLLADACAGGVAPAANTAATMPRFTKLGFMAPLLLACDLAAKRVMISSRRLLAVQTRPKLNFGRVLLGLNTSPCSRAPQTNSIIGFCNAPPTKFQRAVICAATRSDRREARGRNGLNHHSEERGRLSGSSLSN